MNKEPKDFKKYSKSGSILSSVGLLVVLLSVILFIYLDKEKESSIVEVKKEILHKDSITTVLIDTLKTMQEVMKKDQVECIASILKDKMPNGDPLYLFTLQIADSSLLDKLKKVEYYFDHPSYNPKIKASTQKEKNFGISYRGWGCMNTVPVYLHYLSDNKVDTIFFPMCDKAKIELNKL